MATAHKMYVYFLFFAYSTHRLNQNIKCFFVLKCFFFEFCLFRSAFDTPRIFALKFVFSSLFTLLYLRTRAHSMPNILIICPLASGQYLHRFTTTIVRVLCNLNSIFVLAVVFNLSQNREINFVKQIDPPFQPIARKLTARLSSLNTFD